MFKNTILILFIALFCVTTNAQEKFKIYRENQTSTHELGIDLYSFVHQVCPDSFYMTDLYYDLSYDDMALIIKHLYAGVTLKEKVNVHYEQVKPAPAKIAYFVKEDNVKGDIFIMLTNFSNSTRLFVEKPDLKDQLARWYFLKGNRLVYRKDLYTKEIEAQKKNSSEKHEIIEYYLFDDNAENDAQIKPLLDDLLANTKSDESNYYGQIYLVQYHLMNNDLAEAETALKNLEDYFFLNKAIPRNQKIYLNLVKAEYEVMKRLLIKS